MIFVDPHIQQDTVRLDLKIKINETVREKTFALPEIKTSKDFVRRQLPVQKPVDYSSIDTTAVCARNSIADVTFFDPDSFIFSIKVPAANKFLFSISQKSEKKEAESRAILIKSLKQGEVIPVQALHFDWIILIIIFSAFLFSLIRNYSRGMFPAISKFLLFRGINDPGSRDTGGLFHWQSTLLNLGSFLIISLFLYCIAAFYDLIPSGMKGFTFWSIILGVIIVAVTLRHIACIITGSLSGQRDVFREYIVGIYHSYRIGALILFVVVFLLAYTFVLPSKVYVISGFIAIGIMYLIRMLRLLIIFINRNISILYLILYLCALEILPVVISVKYFTGRV